MQTFQSKPHQVEAIQWTGDNAEAVLTELPEKARFERVGAMLLLAGKDGAQGWVNVPVGHWLVHAPGDLSDVWPVDPDYFAAKYDPAA